MQLSLRIHLKGQLIVQAFPKLEAQGIPFDHKLIATVTPPFAILEE